MKRVPIREFDKRLRNFAADQLTQEPREALSRGFRVYRQYSQGFMPAADLGAARESAAFTSAVRLVALRLDPFRGRPLLFSQPKSPPVNSTVSIGERW